MTDQDDEKHSDDIDRASALEMKTTQSALNTVRAAARRQQEVRADGTYAITECEECGEDIGGERLRVSIKNLYCIHCATAQEKRR